MTSMPHRVSCSTYIKNLVINKINEFTSTAYRKAPLVFQCWIILGHQIAKCLKYAFSHNILKEESGLWTELQNGQNIKRVDFFLWIQRSGQTK